MNFVMCVQITAGVLWTKSKKDDKDLGRERNKKLDKVMVFKAKKSSCIRQACAGHVMFDSNFKCSVVSTKPVRHARSLV